MSQNVMEAAGLKMLEMAYQESQNGVNVLVHSEGIPPLPLRSIDSIADNPACVIINCWVVEGHVSGSWVVRLSSIRSIEIPDDLPLIADEGQ